MKKTLSHGASPHIDSVHEVSGLGDSTVVVERKSQESGRFESP